MYARIPSLWLSLGYKIILCTFQKHCLIVGTADTVRDNGRPLSGFQFSTGFM